VDLSLSTRTVGDRTVVEVGGEIDVYTAPKLREQAGITRREILIVSPYFIPGKVGIAELAELRRRGVRVVILTNSLASTDVAAVHAGYKRYRKDMLRLGVELYENKPAGNWGGAASAGAAIRKGKGSSGASLHAKTFVFDRQRLFVGSMNLDPRSIRLNTELGILIDNAVLADAFTKIVLAGLPANAYRVELDARGDFVWITTENGREIRLNTEPQTTAWQRLKVDLLGWLPLEGQL